MVGLLASVAAHLSRHGLIPRGAFHPEPEDGVPDSPGTLVLVGNAGPAMWAAFSRDRGSEADPLDAWTRRVVGTVAAALSARALYPFGGPPYLPFQRWARRAEPVHPSPIGPLIHHDFGLWHAYRGALAFAARIDVPPLDHRPSPCVTCAEKPCLRTCPAGALSAQAYNLGACVGHLASEAGGDCLGLSCRARRACPVGRDYAYEPDQAHFHMESFLAKRRRTGETVT